jgi:tetratricopeptide (TPR) repeat protein
VARAEGVELSIASVTQWLSAQNREWLLIFDNADEDPAAIEGFLVDCQYGNTLITSRNPDMRDLADPGGFIQVKQMGEDEASQLLLRLLHIEDITADALEKINIIVKELGCLPLAIEHAASAINSALCHFGDYLQILRQQFFRLLGDPAMRGASYYDRNQLAAWETSVLAIQSKGTDTKSIESTFELMRILSVFQPTNIMENIFRRAARFSLSRHPNQTTKPITGLAEASAYFPGDILSANKHGEWDPIVFKTAIQMLYRHSFIEVHHLGSTYTLHPLIHSWIRHRMTREQQIATVRAATAVLAASIGRQAETTDYTFSRQLLPHVHALKSFRSELDLPEEYFDDAQSSFWTLFEINERWQEARDIGLEVVEQRSSSQACQIREKVMEAISRLSWAYRMIGTLGEAESLQKQALLYREETLGNENKDTLESMSYLAWIYYDQARYKDAEYLQRYVYKTYKALNYDKHDIFKAATALSEIYCGWTRWEAAVEILKPAIGDMETELGFNSITTVDAKASLAVAYHELYCLEEAELTKLDVLRIRKKIQGDRHPATLTATANLAATYVRQERLDKALDLVEDLITCRTQVLGKSHRDTLTSMLILTNIYIRKKMWTKAEKTCTQVITGREKALPVNHPHTLWAKAHLAMIHHHQRCLDKSASEWQDIIALQQQVRGAEHMETLLSMHNLALVWKSQGHSEKASHLMTKVLTARRRSLGLGHFRTVESEQVLLRWERSQDAQINEEPSPLAGNRALISVGTTQISG